MKTSRETVSSAEPVLVNAITMAEEHPDYSWNFRRRANLRVGDHAIVTMGCHRDARLVVEIDARSDDGIYHGMIVNDPCFSELHGLCSGHHIQFAAASVHHAMRDGKWLAR